MIQVCKMKEPDEKQHKKLLIMSIIGVILGFICLIISICINIFAATTYLGGGTGDIIVVFALPVIMIYGAGIAINAASLNAYRSSNRQKTKNVLWLSIIGLILSSSCIVAIPLFAYQAENKIEEVERKYAETAQMQEAQKIAFETEPTVTNQLFSYTYCYSYKDNTEYRAARDAICSYLRYTYSHDWQEPESARDLILAEYTPRYFYHTSDMERDQYKSLLISRHSEEISRQFLQPSYTENVYVIAPHQSCSREKNDSLISVWYLSNDVYDINKQDLACMYYDYHEDTNKPKLREYEDSALNIYSAEFKDYYEELLRYLYLASYNNQEYDFVVPYRGDGETLTYNNSDFLKTFFSAWPEGYFSN